MSIVPPRWLPAALAAAALTATTARCALADPPAANPAAEGRSFLLRPARVWSAGEPVHYRTLRAGQQARATLLSGCTTLRDLGTEGADYADLSLKRAIEEGLIEGPRLFVVTRAIVASGSYGPAPRSLRPDVCCTPQGAQEASGVPEVIRAVREQAGRGADWIKVYADYRWGPGGS